jgi:POT family proton-dependent oligopeptide transporter
MVIGIVIFLTTKKSLAPIGNSPLMHLEPKKRGTREIAVYIGAALCIPLIHAMIENTDYTDYFMYAIGPAALIYFFFELSRQESSKVKKKLIAALLFIAFSIIFFAFFEQSGGSLSLFAKGNLTDKLLFFTIDPNIVNNVSNAFFVILFAPVLGLVWVALSKKKLEPNTVIKFGLGFLFLAGSFFILYSTKFFAGPDGITSLNIFTSAYLIMTLGELCLSPIGLSIITKLSPNRLVGMMMGLWFLASAYGQYAAGLLGANMASPNENATNLEKLNLYTDGYYQLAIYALIAGIILIVISPIIRKLMQEVK